jgi:protein gp37
MAENTLIEWATHTFNPWEGCQKVGPGCDHCYAETRNARFGGGVAINWGPGAPRRRTSAANWRKPVEWNKAHAEYFAQHSHRQRVFCASLADWLDNETPIEWFVDLLDLIRLTPDLDWLLLSKRIGNWRKRLDEAAVATVGAGALNQWITQWLFAAKPPANVWIGATVVNQEEADRDVPKLLAVPARVRFLSMEPLLGSVDVRKYLGGRIPPELPAADQAAMWGRRSVDWVIAGGESGPNARPMSPDWARALRDQCAAAGVPFLLKQWGEWIPMLGQAEGVPVGKKTTTPDGWVMGWAGKKAAGRTLDGAVHNGFPEVHGG